MFKLEKTNVLDIEDTRIVTYPDGVAYTIKPFEGRDATKAFAKLTKYGSGAFGGILRGAFKSTGDSEEDELGLDAMSLMIAGCLQDAFVDIDDERFLNFLTDELMANVSRSGIRIDYDKEFKMNITRAFDLMRWVIDYNFRPVFQNLDILAFFKKLNPKELEDRG